MGTMAEEMQAIRNTKNRKERQTLMVTHREGMRGEVAAEHLRPGITHSRAFAQVFWRAGQQVALNEQE